MSKVEIMKALGDAHHILIDAQADSVDERPVFAFLCRAADHLYDQQKEIFSELLPPVEG